MRVVKEVDTNEGLGYKMALLLALITVYMTGDVVFTVIEINNGTLAKQKREEMVQLTRLERASKLAIRYAGVVSHAGNGGAFRIGTETIVQCFPVTVPEMKEHLVPGAL